MKLENVIGCILWPIPAHSRGPPSRPRPWRGLNFFFLCVLKAVILCVHLWMCMKNTVDDTSVVVKKKRRALCWRKHFWSTWLLGRRSKEPPQSRRDTKHISRVNSAHRPRPHPTPPPAELLLSWNISPNTPGLFSRLVFAGSALETLPCERHKCFSEEPDVASIDVQNVQNPLPKKKQKHRVLLYSLCFYEMMAINPDNPPRPPLAPRPPCFLILTSGKIKDFFFSPFYHSKPRPLWRQSALYACIPSRPPPRPSMLSVPCSLV